MFKRYNDLAMALAFAVLTACFGSKAQALVSDPAVWIRFDDGAGAAASSSVAGSPGGTLVGGPLWTTGEIGGALQFDGQDDRVSVPESAALRYVGGNMTISAWFYADPADATTGHIVSKPWHGSGEYNYRITLAPEGAVGFVLMEGTSTVSIGTSTAVTRGSWHHVAVTLAADRSIKLYLDGALSASTVHSIVNWQPSQPEAHTALAIGDIYPYMEGTPAHPENAFSGRIDDVRVYTRALSPSDIAELAPAPLAPRPRREPSNWVPEPADPAEGVVWNPISESDIRAQRDAFSWNQTVRLSEVSTKSVTTDTGTYALPPMRYAQIYVRNGDELRELEELGIHYDVTPLFDSEWPQDDSPLVIPTTGDSQDYGATFVFALIPTPVYNAIRDEAFAGEETYDALILRPTPPEALASDGTVSWDYLLANLTSYAPFRTDLTDAGEVVPPAQDAETVTQMRLGNRLRRFVRRVAQVTRLMIDTTRQVIGWVANTFVLNTVLNIDTDLKEFSTAPLRRAWDNGTGHFGELLELNGLRVNVYGRSRLTLYKGKLDASGRTSISVPRSIKVRICFEADSPAATFERGVLRPTQSCFWHRPAGPEDNVHLQLTVSEFYAMAQVIDARTYATEVLGFTPPKAMVASGGMGSTLSSVGGRPFAPCLAATKAPPTMANLFAAALGHIGAGTVLEFMMATDIVTHHEARISRNTMTHEYGHFFFCTLLEKTRRATFNNVWTEVMAPRNLFVGDSSTPVRALNEGIADWFGSQVTGSVNYFSPAGSAPEFYPRWLTGEPVPAMVPGGSFLDLRGPALSQGLERNYGGPVGYANFNEQQKVVSTVTSILHDAIDRADCNTSDAVCVAEGRGGEPWDTSVSPFLLDPGFHDAHASDEEIALSPRDIKDAIVMFANKNGVAGAALNYENVYSELSSKMLQRGYNYDQICHLFSLHNMSGDCRLADLPLVSVGFTVEDWSGSIYGTIQATGSSASSTCTANACTMGVGTNLTLVATPNANAPNVVFRTWAGCSTSNSPTLTLSNVTASTECIARFKEEVGPLQ